MTEENLNLGKVLIETINKTRAAIQSLEDGRDKLLNRTRKRDNPLDDNLYWLTICEHGDGSGYNAELTRYGGNAELMEVIIKELKRQLAEFEKMFDEL